MPSLHSPNKLLERRARAAARGFLVTRPSAGKKFVEVDAPVATRVQAVGKMLEVHRRNNRSTGRNFHFAADAARAAKSLHGESQFVEDKRIIKAGNAAKHSWADWSEDITQVDSAPCTSLVRICSLTRTLGQLTSPSLAHCRPQVLAMPMLTLCPTPLLVYPQSSARPQLSVVSFWEAMLQHKSLATILEMHGNV